MTTATEISIAADRYAREAYAPGHFGDPDYRNLGYLTSEDGWSDRVVLSNAYIAASGAGAVIDDLASVAERKWKNVGKHPAGCNCKLCTEIRIFLNTADESRRFSSESAL